MRAQESSFSEASLHGKALFARRGGEAGRPYKRGRGKQGKAQRETAAKAASSFRPTEKPFRAKMRKLFTNLFLNLSFPFLKDCSFEFNF